eukprot:374497_1
MDIFIIKISCITWMTICLLTCICIDIASFYYLCYQDSSLWINTKYRNLTLITMTAMTLCIIGDWIQTVDDSFHLFMLHFNTHTSIMIIKDFIYFFGNITFYILLLSRLHYLFELSKYALSILICLIIISALLSLSYCAAMIPFWFGNISDRDIFLWWLEVFTIGLATVDFVLNISFFVIFRRKMRNTILGIDSISENEQLHINLISNAITKHCILFGIAIVFNQSWFIFNLIYLFLSASYHTMISDLASYGGRSTEIMVDILVLWLVLRINYNQYICLCKHCHLGVSKCCFKQEHDISNPYHLIEL